MENTNPRDKRRREGKKIKEKEAKQTPEKP